MNSQNSEKLQPVTAILGIVIVIIGLLVTLYVGYRSPRDFDNGIWQDIALILVGISIQLFGIGIIAIGKSS